MSEKESLTQVQLNEGFRLAWRDLDGAEAKRWVDRGADVKVVARQEQEEGAGDGLCRAIEAGEWALARILEFRVKERSHQSGATALMLCAERGRQKEALALAERMLALGAPLWWSDDSGRSALRMAARAGAEGFVNLLIETARDRGELSDYNWAVSQALSASAGAEFGEPAGRVIYALLSAGADPDYKSFVGDASARSVMEAREEPARSELLGALSAFEQRSELSVELPSTAASRSGPRI